MCKEGKSIYQKSRLKARITQESASERLHLSIESIGAYERGETQPPCGVVLQMADLYDDPMLAYRHMTEACPIGKKFLPKFEQREASTAVLCLQKEMADVEEHRRDMVAAACNGTLEKLSAATKEVTEMVGAGLSYLFSGKKRTASVGSTSSSLRQKPVKSY